MRLYDSYSYFIKSKNEIEKLLEHSKKSFFKYINTDKYERVILNTKGFFNRGIKNDEFYLDEIEKLELEYAGKILEVKEDTSIKIHLEVLKIIEKLVENKNKTLYFYEEYATTHKGILLHGRDDFLIFFPKNKKTVYVFEDLYNFHQYFLYNQKEGLVKKIKISGNEMLSKISYYL